MEEQWAELLALAASWGDTLELAETGLRRLEQQLAGLDGRLAGLEAESQAWCLPPSLDTARAELQELGAAMSGLQELQETVEGVRAASEQLPSAKAAGEQVAGVERRLASLQDAAAARRAQLALLQVQEEPGSQLFLSRGVGSGWERCLTEVRPGGEAGIYYRSIRTRCHISCPTAAPPPSGTTQSSSPSSHSSQP
jgi:hypothetical protein